MQPELDYHSYPVTPSPNKKKKTVFLAVLTENVLTVVQPIDGFPGGVGSSIVSSPFDKEVHLSRTQLVSKYTLNLILSLAIDDFGFRRGQGAMAEVFR
jgi:hypothetical protein